MAGYLKMADLGRLGELVTWYKVTTPDGYVIEGWEDEIDAQLEKHGGIKDILIEEQRERKTAAEKTAGFLSWAQNLIMPAVIPAPAGGPPATVTGGADVALQNQAAELLANEKRARTNMMVVGSIGALVLGGVIFFLMGKRK